MYIRVMKVKDLPTTDRPREKLVAAGLKNLTDTELLAIILETGKKGKSVIEVSQELITEAGSLKDLINKSLTELLLIKGLGPAKTSKLAVIGELAKRLNTINRKTKTIKGPSDIYNLLKLEITDNETESLYLFSLNTRSNLIAKDVVSTGTVNETIIHPREIIKIALRRNAVSVIIAHNHPSGDPTPSSEDISVTKRIRDACVISGLNFVDHIVVTNTKFVSMRVTNLI